MGSKPWEFSQDLGVNSGFPTYSFMTLGTALKEPHLQIRVITVVVGGGQVRDHRQSA